jgi:DNA modification methylase
MGRVPRRVRLHRERAHVTPYYQSKRARLYLGDLREVLPAIKPKLRAAGVECCVTDPPYGLEFMGKGWDQSVPGTEFWEVIRSVLLPGAPLFAFGGTRTYHRLACAIEDSGWRLRDCLSWLYGTGFPKSLNIAKADAGAAWDGWGTALKPAWEPIILAMNPCEGTFAENAARYGVAGLAIDRGRLTPSGESRSRAGESSADRKYSDTPGDFAMSPGPRGGSSMGRWPANVCLDEDAAELLDEQSGILPPRGNRNVSTQGGGSGDSWSTVARSSSHHNREELREGGGASRFFYCAKASRAERETGLESDPVTTFGTDHPRNVPPDNAYQRASRPRKNDHPTVKPLSLMRWLVRLASAPGETRILDPFAGSGSTLVAAILEGHKALGIEREERYCEIAAKRLAAAEAEAIP